MREYSNASTISSFNKKCHALDPMNLSDLPAPIERKTGSESRVLHSRHQPKIFNDDQVSPLLTTTVNTCNLLCSILRPLITTLVANIPVSYWIFVAYAGQIQATEMKTKTRILSVVFENW